MIFGIRGRWFESSLPDIYREVAQLDRARSNFHLFHSLTLLFAEVAELADALD